MPITKESNRAKKQGRKYAVSGGQDQIVTKTRFAKIKTKFMELLLKNLVMVVS